MKIGFVSAYADEQNISGASQQNSVAVFFWTAEKIQLQMSWDTKLTLHHCRGE